MDFISENLKVIILALIGLFAVGVAITIRIRKSKKNSNKVVQKNNIVFGDQTGRDKKSN